MVLWFTDDSLTFAHPKLSHLPSPMSSPAADWFFTDFFWGKNEGKSWDFTWFYHGILGEKHGFSGFSGGQIFRCSMGSSSLFPHCFHEIFHGKKPMVFLVVRFSPQSSPSLFTNGRIFHDFPAMAIKNGLMAGKMRWSQLIRGGQDSPWQNNCGFSETTSIVNDS